MEYLYIKYTKKKMLNLYNILMENYSVEQLINEGKDPVEVLHYKYQHVPSSIIDGIINIDPTKKKSYSQWALSKWNDESKIIKTALENGRLEKLFQHFKMHNDIQLQSFPSVEKCLNEFIPNEDTVLIKSKEPKTYLLALDKYVPSEEANDFDIVFNEDNWLIAVPNTYYAECKLGENMKWCTANAFGNGESYYKKYLSRGGKYYVNFNMNEPESVNGKDYPYTRYQFHFESKQFMDYDDQPIESLSEINIPQSAIKFYNDLGYDTDDLEDYETRYERYENERWECSVRVNDDLALMIEFDEDLEFAEPNEYTEYYLFNINHDTRDPISWDTFYNNEETFVDSSNDDGDGISWSILKTTNDELIFVYLNIDVNHRWNSNYETQTIIKYEKNNDDIIILGKSDSHTNLILGYYSNKANALIESNTILRYDENCNIIINEPCTQLLRGESIFVELYDKYEHSLFKIINDEIICIIKSDVPLNSQIFVPDRNGDIVTDFKTYNILYEKNDSNDEKNNYQWNGQLKNGCIIISYEFEKKYEKLNILNPSTKKPVFNFWFDEITFDNSENGIIGFKNEKKFHIATLDGDFISDGYNINAGIVDSNLCIAAGISDSHVDLIDIAKGQFLATFKEMFLHFRSQEGLIHVKLENDIDTFYNYKTRQYEIGQFKNLETLGFIFSSYLPYFYGVNIETNEMVLFNPYTKHILLKGKNIDNFDMFDQELKITKVSFINNTYNLFNLTEEKLLLENNISEIEQKYGSKLCQIFTEDNKVKLYDYKNETYILNSNGWYLDQDITNIQVSDNILVFYIPKSKNLSFTSLYYDMENKQFISYMENDGPSYYKRPVKIDANTPKDVFQYINHLEGRDTQIVTEKFNEILKKIVR